MRKDAPVLSYSGGRICLIEQRQKQVLEELAC